MIKNKEQETIKKLQKLSVVMNDKQLLNEKSQKKKQEKKHINKEKKIRQQSIAKFKTTEVICLIMVTLIASVSLGGLIVYKIFNNKGELVEKELQDFLKNYQYITENYNGDINKKELLEAALEGMLNKLDKNSTYLDSNAANNFNISLEGSYEGLGIEIYNQIYNNNNNNNGNNNTNNDNNENLIVINRVFKGSPADKAGLKEGDIIIKAAGKNVKNMNISDFVKLVANKKGEKIKLAYIRNGKEKQTTITSSHIKLQSVASKIYKKDSQKIGYIRMNIFASNSYEQFKDNLKELNEEKIDSLIIDLRNNSGGYLSVAENIISLFLDSSHPIYQIQKQEQITKYYSKGKKDQEIKIVILVNGSTASASEVLTSALMEQQGAIVIGEKTYGKGTVQELQELTNGDKFKLTTKNWLTSKGVWIHEKGIEPNIKIKLPEEYSKKPTEENDTQLQKAIQELTK